MLTHFFVFSLSPLALLMGGDEILAATMAMVSLASMGVTAFANVLTRRAVMEMEQAAKITPQEKSAAAQRMLKRIPKSSAFPLPHPQEDPFLSMIIVMAGVRAFSWGVLGCALVFNIVQLLRVLI